MHACMTTCTTSAGRGAEDISFPVYLGRRCADSSQAAGVQLGAWLRLKTPHEAAECIAFGARKRRAEQGLVEALFQQIRCCVVLTSRQFLSCVRVPVQDGQQPRGSSFRAGASSWTWT